MSMDTIKSVFNNFKFDDYSWKLNFFMFHPRKKDKGYSADKAKFKDDIFLSNYTEVLFSYVREQLNSVYVDALPYSEDVPKNCLIEINTSDEMVSFFWQKFNKILACNELASERRTYKGYSVYAQAKSDNIKNDIQFVTIADPVVKSGKRFQCSFDSDNELSELVDTMFSLRFIPDFIVYDGVIYSFNTKFLGLLCEDSFNKRRKLAVLQKISDSGIIQNINDFNSHAEGIPANRYFSSFAENKLSSLAESKDEREKVCKQISLILDDNQKIVIDSNQVALRLIQYLCNRVYVDVPTSKPHEVRAPKQLIS